MIGAIGFRFRKNYQAIIYLVGTYNQIDWCKEQSCELGEEYSTYNFKDSDSKINAMKLDRGLDGKFILRLIETKRYVLKVECKEGELIELPYFQNEGNKLLKCDRDKDSVLFQFVNYLGRSRAFFGSGEDGNSLVFEVIPDKMSYENDYIALTESLAQVCSELLLEYSGSTSNLFGQSEDDSQTLLEQFIFLRQFCYSQNIYSLFEAIKRNPDRVLARDEQLKPLGCGMPTGKFYSNPFKYGKGWQKTSSDENGFQSYLPREVSVAQKHDNMDTPANKFIKFALQKFQFICQDLIGILKENGEIKQTECLKEAVTINSMLNDILRDHFWDEVGILDIMPRNNQVLQKREGYSQIFSAYSMIDLALQLNWKGKDDIYEGESKKCCVTL